MKWKNATCVECGRKLYCKVIDGKTICAKCDNKRGGNK